MKLNIKIIINIISKKLIYNIKMCIDVVNNKCFWKEKWGKEHICPITYSRLRPGKYKNGLSYVIKLDCGHRFWRKALIEWMLKSKNFSCPVCRKKIDKLPD